MQKHEYFDELCSLALIGELSELELTEFCSHLEQCSICQKSYAEFNAITTEELPLAASYPSKKSSNLSAASVRQGTLERVVNQGLRITPEALRGPVSIRDRLLAKLDNLWWSIFVWRTQLWISAAVLVVATGAVLGFWRFHKNKLNLESLQTEVVVSKRKAEKLTQELIQARRVQNQGTANTEQLEAALADASARTERVQAEHAKTLDAMASLEETVDSLTQENKTVSQRASGKDAELAALRAQLEQLRATSDNKQAELVATRYEVTELSARLKMQQTVLDQEQQLLAAGRDIRDLMGARDLHIIDVHDMDARGEARPFGRIFLTEGKRLIFYAYDLDSAKVKDASFQAWGQRTDGRQKAISLGILYLDDQKQSRWALKVEDPNLLSEIDSLFVTVEPHGGTEKPTGKKLMYAFLRNPINHP